MNTKLPTNDRQNRSTEIPAFKRIEKETEMEETDAIQLASAKQMRAALVDVSGVIDRIITGGIGFDDVAVELRDLNDRVDVALGAATLVVDDCPQNVIRPAKMSHTCSHCGDELADWSTGIHWECRQAKDLVKDKPTN